MEPTTEGDPEPLASLGPPILVKKTTTRVTCNSTTVKNCVGTETTTATTITETTTDETAFSSNNAKGERGGGESNEAEADDTGRKTEI